ncbi:MAG TPA: carbohydrate-binding family 9-like protein [Pyrinomonadaceae bacterium]|jgi:hypothetical protein
MSNVIEVRRANAEVGAGDFAHEAWDRARSVYINRYWSGAEAPAGRHAEARLIWTETALVVRFVCAQTEPLVVSDAPRVEQKTIGLWERDVCEIFLAPDARAPERYFEFEAAPTGEWLDLAIHTLPNRRDTDWRFNSGMTTAARIEENSIMIAMRVPWASMLSVSATKRPPRVGERWRVNLFRCVGAGDERGYLAWQPTETPQPTFHVPQKFGWLDLKR